VVGLAFVLAEAIALFTLWMVRRPGFSNTIRFCDIQAVRSRLMLGSLVALFVAVFVLRKVWSGWSFEAELVYLLTPAAVGVWILVKRPLTQGGLLAKKSFETLIGVMMIVSGLMQVSDAWQQRPTSTPTPPSALQIAP